MEKELKEQRVFWEKLEESGYIRQKFYRKIPNKETGIASEESRSYLGAFNHHWPHIYQIAKAHFSQQGETVKVLEVLKKKIGHYYCECENMTELYNEIKGEVLSLIKETHNKGDSNGPR